MINKIDIIICNVIVIVIDIFVYSVLMAGYLINKFVTAGISSFLVVSRKTIQNTPFQQHTIFSNTEMLWGGFLFLFLYIFFHLKNSLFCVLNIIPYYCIYRNVIPQNLNSLLRLVVAKWTFAVWFHALLCNEPQCFEQVYILHK